ncbi:MAG: aspartyl/glutamyl-tRNA amidotransferase subunit C [Anaerolineales bacterium]
MPTATDDNQEGKITPSIFAHLTQLAAFDLDPEEAEYLRRELNQQMRAIRELEAIELDEHLPITSHGVPYTPETSPSLRPDQSEPCPLADDILKQAPEVEERYIVVPDIPHEDLE